MDYNTQGIAIDSTENFLSFNEGVSYEEGKETLEKIFSLREIAVLELISLGVAGAVTFFYEIFFRSLSEWVSILAKGMLIAVIVIVSITVIYVLSQIVWVLRSQPVDVLRNSE